MEELVINAELFENSKHFDENGEEYWTARDLQSIFGYKGLYNGETADDIAKRKGLRCREDILDNMEIDELIAYLFRISQTEQRLRKDHVGTKMRHAVHIIRLGKLLEMQLKKLDGTMPEDLSTLQKSLEKREIKSLIIVK